MMDHFQSHGRQSNLARGSHRRVVGLGGALLIACVAASEARVTELPKSFRQPVGAAVHSVAMPAVDIEALRAEDAILAHDLRPGPIRFAAQIPVSYDLKNAGTWEDLDGGGRLWRLRVRSEGALSLNFGFHRFDLPPGAGLWLYDAAGDRIEGPYTWRHRSVDGKLWTPVILGDVVILEVYLPPDAGKAALELSEVNHGYRYFGEVKDKQGSCNIDVICPEASPYADQIRSVARFTIGPFLCTGQLVNNTAGDFRPLFLTAQHCGVNASNASSMVVFWNYESPSCGLLSGGSLEDSQTGATHLASHEPSDFTLVELSQTPSAGSSVFYAGWDAGGAAPRSVVGIHHPRGDEKAIAFEGDPLVSVDVGEGGETHWQVTAWDTGTTEGGSSGSCIFDQTSKACVGTLTGGFASCENPTGFDVYGKFSQHWTGGGTDDTRLSNWLDPAGGGATTFLDGADPTGDPGPGDDDDDDDDDDDGGPLTCIPDSRTMCLEGGRFETQIGWTDFNGMTGEGFVSPLGTDYFGVYWFFTAMNGEVLVKVLDGCAFNNHYWVFVAAATNVGFELTVTDSTTGGSRTYSNDLGEIAPSVVDTTAFAACP